MAANPAYDDPFRLVASLHLAAADMTIARAGAERLAEGTEESAPVRHALMAGVMVSYARPWTQSRGRAFLFPLDTKAPPEVLQEILPAEGTDERRLHDTIVTELRHKVYAHTDADSPLRTVSDPGMLLMLGQRRLRRVCTN